MLEECVCGDYRASGMAGTTIQLCGRYVAELEGERIEARLPGRQGRLLFAYLVLSRDRTVGRGVVSHHIGRGRLCA